MQLLYYSIFFREMLCIYLRKRLSRRIELLCNSKRNLTIFLREMQSIYLRKRLSRRIELLCNSKRNLTIFLRKRLGF